MITTVVIAATLALASAAYAFDPAVEAQNYSKGQERQAIYNTPEYQALLRQVSAQNQRGRARDAGRRPRARSSRPTCARSGDDGCAGDVRLYDWEPKGYGIVKPVLFTARNGATISGHVWATKAGPGEATGHRDHQRLGAGRRAALLVRRPDARQGGLRRADLGPAGPGPVRHQRRGARPERGRARPERRPAVLRRHRGRAQLLLLDPVAPVRAGARAATAARATPPSRTGA